MHQAGTKGSKGRSRALVAISVLVGALALTFGGGLHQGAQADLLPGLLSPPTTKPAPPTTKPGPKPHVAVNTYMASPVGDVPTYDAPNGRRIGAFGHWYGWPQTTPVLEFRGDWIKVRLPERPNGSTAWIKKAGVKITQNPWRIVVRHGMTDLTIYWKGFPYRTFPVGLGKASTPTPLGSFYLGVIEPQADTSNGVYAYASTAHSEAIQSWEGTGDAVIAIHGPVSAKSDRQIGSRGTYISNGCVRMHMADLDQMRVVPLGTPIDIVP